jgi:hypothetical protein
MKVLVLVISCQNEPYKKMMETSLSTWDSIHVDGVETVFYCGNPVKENTDKIIYFPIEESLFSMGEKTLRAYEWALKNKQFDYIARVNSSCYVNKKELIKHVQTLPKYKLFSGLIVNSTPPWVWGGGNYIISRDVIEEIVDHKYLWDHKIMEDMAASYVVSKLNIPFTPGKACSIEKRPTGWFCLCYGGESKEFTDFKDLKVDQYFFRVKQDGRRDNEDYIMKELYQNL